MTCIEKLRELHPEWDEEKIAYAVKNHCPDSYFIEQEPERCALTGDGCVDCWNREVRNENAYKWTRTIWFRSEDMRRLYGLAERLGESASDVIADALKLLEDCEKVADAYADIGTEYRISTGDLAEVLEVE